MNDLSLLKGIAKFAARTIAAIAIVLPVFGQVPDGPPKRSNDIRDAHFERIQIELRNILLEAPQIPVLSERAAVVSDASLLLNSFDRLTANRALGEFIDDVLAKFERLSKLETRTSESARHLKDAESALKIALRTFTRLSPDEATSIQEKYFKLKSDMLNRSDIDDALQSAAEGLEIDEARGIALFRALLSQGVPSRFPSFIQQLSESNPEVAASLVAVAIDNLGTNQRYGPRDALYISTVIFNEPVIIIPELRDQNSVNDFAVFTNYVGQPAGRRDVMTVSAYYSAAANFWQRAFANTGTGPLGSGSGLLQSYYLFQKLNLYRQQFPQAPSAWVEPGVLQLSSTMLSRGFSQETLTAVSAYAARLVQANNPLDLDDGSGLLEKAEKSKTEEERTAYLIQAVIRLIDNKEFAKAESLIFDLKKAEIREALQSLVNLRAGLAAIEMRDWRTFENRSNSISDKGIKAFLFLSALNAIPSTHEAQRRFEYARKAEGLIGDIATPEERANAAILLAALVLSDDSFTNGLAVVSTAIQFINDSPNYRELPFKVAISIPTVPSRYVEAVGQGTYRSAFNHLGRRFPDESGIYLNRLRSVPMRQVARIAAARGIIERLEKQSENDVPEIQNGRDDGTPREGSTLPASL